MKVTYECNKCRATWEQEHGPSVPCPNCGCYWVEWTNYEECKENAKNDKTRSFGK